MVTAKQLQNQYIRLYSQLRNYFWPMYIIEDIVNLEIEVYKSFPSIAEVQRLLDVLQSNVTRLLINPDEDLDVAFDEFQELVSESDEIYVKLYQVREDLSYEDF